MVHLISRGKVKAVAIFPIPVRDEDRLRGIRFEKDFRLEDQCQSS